MKRALIFCIFVISIAITISPFFPLAKVEANAIASEQNAVLLAVNGAGGFDEKPRGFFERRMEGISDIKPPEVRPVEPEKPVPSSTVIEQPVPINQSNQSQIAFPAGAVSFFFDDADIFEVAQTVFGDILRVNYVIDPKISGRVNFRTVAPIPRTEVLTVMEIILRLNGIGFVVEGGLYRIVPLSEVSRELIYSQIGKDPGKVAIELFTFKNLNLKDSMKDIENAIGISAKGGMLRVLPIYRLNALLVVASTKEQLDYVRTWVSTFDQIFQWAKPTVYVYPVQNSKAIDVANLLQQIFLGAKSASSSSSSKTAQPSAQTAKTSTTQPAAGAQAQTAQPSVPSSPLVVPAPSGGESLVSEITKIFPDEVANSIIILATAQDYELISETIKKIDIAPRQVMLEGLIVQVKLKDNLSFGLSWSVNTDVNISNIKPFNNNINLTGDVNINSPATAAQNISSKGFTFVGKDPSGTVRAVLTALTDESTAKVLAAPHILVSDNREARIQVGSQVPLTTSQTSTTAATGTVPSITSTVQYKDIGIILKVKPQVNDSGLISLELSQEISSIGDVSVDVGGLKNITIDKIEAMSNLVAQDGETIIIGGLIREDTTKSKDGIPLLSKIPIIGNLFGNTTDDMSRTELVILLTPHVIRNQQEAKNVTSDYMQRLKGVKKEILEHESVKGKAQKDQNGAGESSKQ